MSETTCPHCGAPARLIGLTFTGNDLTPSARTEGGTPTYTYDPPPLDAAERAVVEVRPEVWAFALAMEDRLKANDWKDGWVKGMSPDQFLRGIRREYGELRSAIDFASDLDAVLEEAADTANFAMIVAAVTGALLAARAAAAKES